MVSPQQRLGEDCSEIGSHAHGDGVAAYVVYRGAIIAGFGPDRTAAEAELAAKIDRHLPALRAFEEIAAVEEVNLVLEQPGTPTQRVFARPMTPARALLELDLGIGGAVVFRDPQRGTYAIRSRAVDGTPQLVHLGEPVRGDDASVRPLPQPGRTPTPAIEDELHASKRARVRTLLRCPLCRGGLDDMAGGMRCGACEREFPLCAGRPLLTVDPAYDGLPRDQLESQNPYGQQVIELIEQNRDGWVLDMGSGSPNKGFYNVVHLDLAAYDQVDVVTDGRALPFADETFDAILSEAVLEHVRDPDEYMAEVARVLKPGGRVRVDVAFLQPFHAYPDHYFNMTSSGLRVTIERAGLAVSGLGVGEHQQPWVALGLLTAGVVTNTIDPRHQQQILGMTIGEMLQRLERQDATVFQSLPQDAVERYAAGFWCLAEKPR